MDKALYARVTTTIADMHPSVKADVDSAFDEETDAKALADRVCHAVRGTPDHLRTEVSAAFDGAPAAMPLAAAGSAQRATDDTADEAHMQTLAAAQDK